MSSIKVSEDGYVNTNITQKMKESESYLAIQYLEDGLSYLNYAKLKSDRGCKDPKKDYDVGIDFVMSALNSLVEQDQDEI